MLRVLSSGCEQWVMGAQAAVAMPRLPLPTGPHTKLTTSFVIHYSSCQAALEAYLAGVQRSPMTEDAIYRAQQLLAALAQLGDI